MTDTHFSPESSQSSRVERKSFPRPSTDHFPMEVEPPVGQKGCRKLASSEFAYEMFPLAQAFEHRTPSWGRCFVVMGSFGGGGSRRRKWVMGGSGLDV